MTRTLPAAPPSAPDVAFAALPLFDRLRDALAPPPGSATTAAAPTAGGGASRNCSSSSRTSNWSGSRSGRPATGCRPQ